MLVIYLVGANSVPPPDPCCRESLPQGGDKVWSQDRGASRLHNVPLKGRPKPFGSWLFGVHPVRSKRHLKLSLPH